MFFDGWYEIFLTDLQERNVRYSAFNIVWLSWAVCWLAEQSHTAETFSAISVVAGEIAKLV